MCSARPSKSHLHLGFTEFPQQVFESRFSFFVAVGHQEDAVVGELAGEAGEFVELLGSDFVAAEAHGGDFQFIESHDVVHSFDDDDAVAVEGFFDPGFLKPGGVAAVEFEAAMESRDVAMLAGFLAFWFA